MTEQETERLSKMAAFMWCAACEFKGSELQAERDRAIAEAVVMKTALLEASKYLHWRTDDLCLGGDPQETERNNARFCEITRLIDKASGSLGRHPGQALLDRVKAFEDALGVFQNRRKLAHSLRGEAPQVSAFVEATALEMDKQLSPLDALEGKDQGRVK